MFNYNLQTRINAYYLSNLNLIFNSNKEYKFEIFLQDINIYIFNIDNMVNLLQQ